MARDHHIILDRDGQPLRRKSNWDRNLRKSAESLLGICQGLVANGELTEQGVAFLHNWLSENPEIADAWPGYVLRDRLALVLEDGVVTKDEARNLHQVLSAMIGGTLEESGATGGLATRLPVQHIDSMPIDGHRFCFTGQFLFGSRAACQAAVESLGGEVLLRIRKDLDYLVIGAMSSADWAYSSHGRKIEKAVSYRDAGAPIAIIAEELWTEQLALAAATERCDSPPLSQSRQRQGARKRLKDMVIRLGVTFSNADD